MRKNITVNANPLFLYQQFEPRRRRGRKQSCRRVSPVVAYSVSRKLFREVTVRELLCSMINTGHPARRARLAYYKWLACQSINQRNYTSDGWPITLSRGSSSHDRPRWRISYDGLLRRVVKRVGFYSLPQGAREKEFKTHPLFISRELSL